MSERIMDIQLTIDGVILKEGESIEDYISKVEKVFNTSYPVLYEILSDEFYEQ